MSMYNNAGRYRAFVVNSCSSEEDRDDSSVTSSGEEDAESEAEFCCSASVLPPPSTLVITRRQKDFGVTTERPRSEQQNGTQNPQTRWKPRDLTVVKITCVHT